MLFSHAAQLVAGHQLGEGAHLLRESREALAAVELSYRATDRLRLCPGPRVSKRFRKFMVGNVNSSFHASILDQNRFRIK
jgi:hypothetical protein